MNQLWASAVEVLNKKADPAAREARFRQLFHEDFDCPGIARFVLGRYWRSASEEEQQEFVRFFEDYVVFVYTARLGDFGGETFKIRSSRSDGDGIIVSTEVFSPGSTSPLRIDWRLVTVNGVYKISDVIDEPLPRWSRGPALTRGPGTLTSQVLFRDNCGTSNRVPSARKDGIAVFRHPIGIPPRM